MRGAGLAVQRGPPPLLLEPAIDLRLGVEDRDR
eukprot:SAG22_NODE_6052_length_909_cov_1.322222_1_plen_32_part_10